MKHITVSPSDSPYKLLNSGVDTLVLNVRPDKVEGEKYELPDSLIAQFNEWQALAREEEELVPVPSLCFNGATLVVYPHGAGRGQWSWIFDCPSFKLYVGRGKLNGVIAQVRFSALYLWSFFDKNDCQNIWSAIDEVSAFLCSFFHLPRVLLQPSEVHLCADVAGWDVPASDWQRTFLTRARVRTEIEETLSSGPSQAVFSGHRLATLQFGVHKAPLSATIYNKSAEIKVSGKLWNQDIWLRRGWDRVSTVWRIEIRWKREALHNLQQPGVFHGIETIADLKAYLSYLWTYSVGHIQGGPDGLPDGWLRFTQPTDDTTLSRWPVHPAWQAIQSAFCTETESAVNVHTGEVLDLPVSLPLSELVRKRHNEHNLKRILLQLNGLASTVSAYVSPAGTDEPLSFLSVCAWLIENLPSYILEDLAALPPDVMTPDILKAEFQQQFKLRAIDKQSRSASGLPLPPAITETSYQENEVPHD
jgi:hypothetical protein